MTRAYLLGVSNPTHSRSLQLDRLLTKQYESVEITYWHGPKIGAANFTRGIIGISSLIASAFITVPRLWWQVIKAGFRSTVVVSHPSQLNLLCVFPLIKLLKQTVIADFYVSLSDTLVDDRGLLGANGTLDKLLTKIDKFTLSHADMVIFDTRSNMERTLVRHPSLKIRGQTLYPEPPKIFRSAISRNDSFSEKKDVLFYGNFSPLMGVDVVATAFASPRLSHLRLTLVGNGQGSENRKIPNFGSNVERILQVPFDSVPSLLTNHKLSLGVFGGSEKAASVFPNKVIESLMTGTPCITRKGEISNHFGEIGCLFINPDDPEELIDAILRLTESSTLLEIYSKKAFEFSKTWRPQIRLDDY